MDIKIVVDLTNKEIRLYRRVPVIVAWWHPLKGRTKVEEVVIKVLDDLDISYFGDWFRNRSQKELGLYFQEDYFNKARVITSTEGVLWGDKILPGKSKSFEYKLRSVKEMLYISYRHARNSRVNDSYVYFNLDNIEVIRTNY